MQQKQFKKVYKEDLLNASTKAGIVPSQAEHLWNLLVSPKKQTSLFGFSHIFFFLGVIILFCAFGWIEMEGSKIYGVKGQFYLSLSSFIVISILGISLWANDIRKTWGGWTLVLTLGLVPFVIHSLFNTLKWTMSNSSQLQGPSLFCAQHPWMFMASATIIATSIALFFIRFPPFLIPLYLSLWALIVEITDLFITEPKLAMYSFDTASILFGVISCFITWGIDKKTKTNFAFWGYLISALSLWTGLTFKHLLADWSYFGYLLANILMITLGFIIKRPVFLVFGALGIIYYLGMLVYQFFPNSPLGFLILMALALGAIVLGIASQRYLKRNTKQPNKPPH